MSKRCTTCGRQAIIRGARGQRACPAHAADVGEPRWLRLPGPATDADLADTLAGLDEAGALDEQLLAILGDLHDPELTLGELDTRAEEMLNDARMRP